MVGILQRGRAQVELRLRLGTKPPSPQFLTHPLKAAKLTGSQGLMGPWVGSGILVGVLPLR